MVAVLAERYEIVKPLGSGGFGQTFLAKDNYIPNCPLCVVKQFKPQQNDLQNLNLAKRLFDSEAEILYHLGEHDQIPRLLAHFKQDSELYLVEEYIEGQTLNQEISQQAPLSQCAVIKILQDVLEVLVFVHGEKVIHRDIKPANLIRRASDGKIVLIDFGSVKKVNQMALENYGQAFGTVSVGSRTYMPLEQQFGNPDFSSDLYALGIVCLYALTGISPEQLPKDSKTGEYQCTLLSDRAIICPQLAQILNQMVHQDHRQRYPNATEALKALIELINSSNDEQTSYSVTSLPIQDWDEPRGHIPLGSSFYIERSTIETRCYREIMKQSALIRIKAPMDMGKTSLLVRILDYAQQQGYRTILLPFERFEESVCSDLNQLLRRFCALVSRELGICAKKIDDYWDDEFFGPNDNCLQYFEECLLPTLDCPLVLALDDLDLIFPQHRVAKEFLKLVRFWHEQAKTKSIWSKVRLILAYSTEVYVVMDTNSSPFNVGVEVELPEFSVEQVGDLAQRYGLNWNETQINHLMAMIGGHPYLVRVALDHVAHYQISLEQLLETAPTDAGLYGNHLRRHLRNLQQYPQLKTAMQTVVKATEPVRLESELEFKLHRLGLVNFQGNEVTVRSELYRQYFREH